jgi:hemolysin D
MVNNLSKNNINSNSQPTIKILLVDDGRVIREKLKSILRSYPDIKVIGTAADGYSAIEQLEYLHPDIILLDLDMPNLDGIGTAKIIDRKYPHLKVIILTSHEDASQINDASCACIKEYIIKDNNIDLRIADSIRSVYSSGELNHKHDNVVEINRSALATVPDKNQLTQRQIDRDFDNNAADRFSAIANTTVSKLNDWSNSAKELIDMMPLPWTRGLLYLLVISLGIAIPWACLFKMDEIGTARGRLEFKGNTIKLESDLDGSVAVLKVYVKKGELVKAGQIIMELDSKNIREQIYQNQLKLDGQQQRLNQLQLMKNQMGLGTNAQEQQNQAQLLEKQSQIAQAEQNLASLQSNAQSQSAEKLAQLNQAERTFIDRQSSYNLQKAEKLTQVRQAEQGVVDAQTNYIPESAQGCSKGGASLSSTLQVWCDSRNQSQGNRKHCDGEKATFYPSISYSPTIQAPSQRTTRKLSKTAPTNSS